MINVELTIKGMIALFFEKKSGKDVACQAGVVADAPEHEFKLNVSKNGTSIKIPHIDKNLKLVVAPNPAIILTSGNINRRTGTGAQKSFKWVLDFESEVYTFDIGSSVKRFKSILHINSGEFFTEKRSENRLIEFDEQSGRCKSIGFVATVVGVHIELAAGQTAKFFNGASELFTATPADECKVELLNERHVHEGSIAQHHGDANFFYSAVGHKIPQGQKKVFSSTILPPEATSVPATPEAACLIPRGGRGPIQSP